MRTEPNEGMGTTVILEPGDSLDSVPTTHSHLLTPALTDAFDAPERVFASIADACPFTDMRNWLRSLIADGSWTLELHVGDPPEWTAAGYEWTSASVRGAMIDLPSGTCSSPSPSLNRYYNLVGTVDWMGFGCAGGLSGPGEHALLRTLPYEYRGDPIDPDDTIVWGWSPCGDMVIATGDDRGGWVSHETGHVHLLGTVADTINWVFRRLADWDVPEFDYNWT